MIAMALRATEVLVAVAIAIGTLELLALRRAFSDEGTWRWVSLAPELGRMGVVLRYRPFLLLLGVRLVAALALLAGITTGGLVALVLWVTSLLVNVRFRGTFNGGSDAMTMVVLTGLAVAHLGAGHPVVVTGAMLYIAAQAILSYFIAGVVKVVNPDWRNGEALRAFVARRDVAAPLVVQRLLEGRPARVAASWLVMGFELAFPLALASPPLAFALVGIAAAFHLGNVVTFGLNRFLMAWAASWPAVVAAASLAASR